MWLLFLRGFLVDTFESNKGISKNGICTGMRKLYTTKDDVTRLYQFAALAYYVI